MLRTLLLAVTALLMSSTWVAAPIAMAQSTPALSESPAWTAPQRRRIILMRHGDVAYFDASGKPVPDPDKVALSEKGRAQAAATGGYFKSIGISTFDRVISSNLPRTVETAEIALAAAGIAGKPAQIDALREMRNGSSKEISTPDLPREMLLLTETRVPGNTKFLGKESVSELQARIGPALAALLADKGWNTALLTLHALVNNAILSSALTGDTAFYGRFDHGAGCFSIIDVGDDFSDAVVKAVNICPNPAPYQSRLKTLESLLEQALKGRK